MAAITVTPTALPFPSGAQTETRLALETITAGMVVYLDSTTNKYGKADANVVGKQTIRGIALNGGVADESITIQKTGTLVLGSGVANAVLYVLDAAVAGGIAPSVDLATGWIVGVIGVGNGTTEIILGILNSGVTK